MGYYDGDQYQDLDDQGQQYQQGPGPGQVQKNPLRDHLKKVEDQNAELQKQLSSLLARQRQNDVADALQAKGYDRAAATLYQGDPAKLDEWLATAAPLLAKQPTPMQGDGAAGQGTQAPASTVPADGQAALQQLQQAGSQAAPPQGSEAEQIAAMNSADDPAKLMQYLQSQGNPHFWNG